MNHRTIRITPLAIAGPLALGPVLAGESLPLRSVNEANAVIDAALEAHGGAGAAEKPAIAAAMGAN